MHPNDRRRSPTRNRGSSSPGSPSNVVSRRTDRALEEGVITKTAGDDRDVPKRQSRGSRAQVMLRDFVISRKRKRTTGSAERQSDDRAADGPLSPVDVIRRKSPSPQVHSSETPIGLIVPSAFCSETYTDSQDRHTATILERDSDLLITRENGTLGYHHCSKMCRLLHPDRDEQAVVYAGFGAVQPRMRTNGRERYCDVHEGGIDRLTAGSRGTRSPRTVSTASAHNRSGLGSLLNNDDRLPVDHRLLGRVLDHRVEPVSGVAKHLDDLAGGSDGLADLDRFAELEIL